MDFRHVVRGALLLATLPLVLRSPYLPGHDYPALVIPVLLVLLGVLTLHRRRGLSLDPVTQALGLIPLAYGTTVLVGETMGLLPAPLGLGVEAVRAAPDWLAVTAVVLDYAVMPMPAAVVGGYGAACLMPRWRPLAGGLLFLPTAVLSMPAEWGGGSLAGWLMDAWAVVSAPLVGVALGWLMGAVVDRLVAPDRGRAEAGEGAAAG